MTDRAMRLVGSSGDAIHVDLAQQRRHRIDALGVDRRHVQNLKLPPTPPEAIAFESWLAKWQAKQTGPRIVWRWIIAGENPPWRWACPWNLWPEPWMAPMSAEWVESRRRIA